MWWLEQLSIDPPVRSLAPVLGHLEVVKAAWPVAGEGKPNKNSQERRPGAKPWKKKKKKTLPRPG